MGLISRLKAQCPMQKMPSVGACRLQLLHSYSNVRGAFPYLVATKARITQPSAPTVETHTRLAIRSAITIKNISGRSTSPQS